jgi:hypothetical protein
LQHHDPVGVADRGQAVGDDQAGAASEQHLQRPLDRQLGEAVDVGGGLVQDQDAKLISWRWPIERLRPRWPSSLS